ncbi:hypothetical protein Tco_0380778, partial [Tanacetum coccineum]
MDRKVKQLKEVQSTRGMREEVQSTRGNARRGPLFLSCIPIVKVRWNMRRGPEYMWECEDQFKSKYPHLFKNPTAPTT